MKAMRKCNDEIYQLAKDQALVKKLKKQKTFIYMYNKNCSAVCYKKIINFDRHSFHCIYTCRYILQILSKFSHKIQVSSQANKLSKTSYKVNIIFR